MCQHGWFSLARSHMLFHYACHIMCCMSSYMPKALPLSNVHHSDYCMLTQQESYYLLCCSIHTSVRSIFLQHGFTLLSNEKLPSVFDQCIYSQQHSCSRTVWCALPHVLCHRHYCFIYCMLCVLLLHLLNAVYCPKFCAIGTAAPFIKFCHRHCRFVPWALLYILYAVDMLYALYWDIFQLRILVLQQCTVVGTTTLCFEHCYFICCMLCTATCFVP